MDPNPFGFGSLYQEAWMFESDTSDASTSAEFRRLRPDHELWVAMRTAHAQLVDATGVLDELIARAPEGGTSSDENRVMAMAAGQQRAAFQEYIEARLAFAEFLLSRDSASGPPPPAPWIVRTPPPSTLPPLPIPLFYPPLL